MFRHGLRRCAGLASAASASMLPRSRALAPVARQGIASLGRSSVPLKSIAQCARMYSSEVTAEDSSVVDAAAAATPEEATQFAHLEQLGVHRNLLKAITDDMGYEDMTPVQAKTINPALKGTDIVAQAKTGTGKTLAFLLPLLQRMLVEDPSLASRQAMRHARSDDIRGIVLSPTRELAEQIATEARRLVRHTGLVVQSAVGGTRKADMLRQTQRQGCHLLVATPGRLNDLLQDPASGIDAPNLAALVLDEADRMLDVGFEAELQEIMRCLPNKDEKVRQTMLVSATIPDNVIRLARSMVRPQDFQFVQTIAENESLTHARVPQHIVAVSSWANIFPSLFELIDRESAKSQQDRSLKPFKAIVYFNTTALVELGGELGFYRRRSDLMQIPTFSIHSGLTQNQRTKAADLFRRARTGVIFSSDVTARGMDFPDVTHVIQIDAPRDRESYIHRLGRTGRQNKEGEGWLLMPPMSLSSARRLLKGLPLQQNKSLESAAVDIASGDLPQGHREMLDLANSIKKHILGGAYKSIFGGGQHSNKDELVDDLNLWATMGWGWAEPPAVSSTWARGLGLARSNLNIQDGMARRDSGNDRGDRRGPGRFNSRSSDDRRSSDPFVEMGRHVRRDGPGSGRGSGRSQW
ncbi:RNA helicase [Purpureocillium takamizusanense]|uniref:ATP-dependent RNA helicase n=1 Tax=Purpureocillium takamizusanense TaxID=2060973 RepID=A0A9Q8VDY8_9HYPO|nr:RNA helicase [Purpureocillium takamizusanense]UNI21726.1 RNA helicase [Purpureocillium takamizusanense]